MLYKVEDFEGNYQTNGGDEETEGGIIETQTWGH